MAPSGGNTIAKKMGQFPDIALWLEKSSDVKFFITEHNIDREHHHWGSEPELYLYKPGCEPHNLLVNKRRNGRRLSIESGSINSSQRYGAVGQAHLSRKASSRRMRLSRLPSSSKSDSYHRKYEWDLAFRERAVVAIQEECRQIRKIKSQKPQSRHHPLQPSVASSGDDCSGVSCKIDILAYLCVISSLTSTCLF